MDTREIVQRAAIVGEEQRKNIKAKLLEKFRTLSDKTFSAYLRDATGYDDEEFSTLYCGGIYLFCGSEGDWHNLEAGLSRWLVLPLTRASIIATSGGAMTVFALLEYNQSRTAITQGSELCVLWN